MTESPEPHFVYPDPQLLPRSGAAGALRRLGNALVRHRTDPSTLAAVESWAAELAELLERGEPVQRPNDYLARRYTDPRPPDGAELVAFSDRPFSGPTNPMGFDVELRRHGEGVRARVVYGAAFESAPGRAHGGAISAAVDDVMGYLMVAMGVAAYTARLEIDYLGGVPVDQPVWFEANEVERDGRKLHVELTARSGDDRAPNPAEEPLIRARGLFVIIPPHRLQQG